MKKIIFGTVLLAIIIAVLISGLNSNHEAETRWFKDQAYNYETLRTMGEGVYGGSDTAEVLVAIKNIQEGDDESWYKGWYEMAERVANRAINVSDPVSRGKAMLRASNYYRTAEFFLLPQDERRHDTFPKSVANFYQGLKNLGIHYEKIRVPYESKHLNAVFYDGGTDSQPNPLVVAHGGYDSTQEELYYFVVAAALERGYSVLTFSGPGQGAAIREQGLLFTPEWEKPTTAVLDAYIAQHGKPGKIVLIGSSLGGYLAPRAAAFDKRIDGVVAFDVSYDFQEAALRQVPGFARMIYDSGHTGLVNMLFYWRMRSSPGIRWGFHNARWTMGAKDPSDLLKIFEQYNLRDESELITADVLILAGEKDHFFPVEQVEEFRKALVNARSVTTRTFTEKEGGHEHCQQGALNLFHETLFDWFEQTF